MKTVEQNAEVGIIVARFQSPFLHEGHIEVLNTVIANHPRVIVFLGLAQLRCTFNNPYDFDIRMTMLKEQYPKVEVSYIEDVGDDEIWSRNLDRLIGKSIGPNFKPLLYGSRDSFIKGYKGKYPTIELVPTKFISASEIRREAGLKAKHTLDFRLGMAHMIQNQYPSFKPTVDAAIVNRNTNELLLARKPHETLLRFPGGFTDPSKDTSAEEAVLRETKEETGLIIEHARYIGSTIVDDPRYRGEVDKIMTFLYLLEYNGGTPVAGDDISYVCWKKFSDIRVNDIVPTHRPLIHMLNDHFVNTILRLA